MVAASSSSRLRPWVWTLVQKQAMSRRLQQLLRSLQAARPRAAWVRSVRYYHREAARSAAAAHLFQKSLVSWNLSMRSF